MLAKRLKLLRKEMNLTQKKLASELNTSQQMIGYWETNKQRPTHEYLTKLSIFFDVSTDYLLGNSDIRKPEEEIDLDDFEILYRNTSKGLSDEDKAQLEIDLKAFLLERQRLINERNKSE